MNLTTTSSPPAHDEVSRLAKILAAPSLVVTTHGDLFSSRGPAARMLAGTNRLAISTGIAVVFALLSPVESAQAAAGATATTPSVAASKISGQLHHLAGLSHSLEQKTVEAEFRGFADLITRAGLPVGEVSASVTSGAKFGVEILPPKNKTTKALDCTIDYDLNSSQTYMGAAFSKSAPPQMTQYLPVMIKAHEFAHCLGYNLSFNRGDARPFGDSAKGKLQGMTVPAYEELASLHTSWWHENFADGVMAAALLSSDLPRALTTSLVSHWSQRRAENAYYNTDAEHDSTTVLSQLLKVDWTAPLYALGAPDRDAELIRLVADTVNSSAPLHSARLNASIALDAALDSKNDSSIKMAKASYKLLHKEPSSDAPKAPLPASRKVANDWRARADSVPRDSSLSYGGKSVPTDEESDESDGAHFSLPTP